MSATESAPLRPSGPEEDRFTGRVFRVTSVPVTLASGRETRRDVVRHPGAVAILPYSLDPPSVVLLRQFRFAVGKYIWEIPAGTLDVDGEPPEGCARRELLEETGLEAGQWTCVGEFYTAPGFTDERMSLFAASSLTTADERPPADDDERIETHRMTWDEVRALRERGEIEDAKTLVALGWFERALAGEEA